MRTTFRLIGSWLAVALIATGLAPALAADDVPQTTPEGMELVKQTSSRITYAMPGATLDGYTQVALLDCYVAFAKDWEKDYNRNVSMSRRVRADDMEKIKAKLAEQFKIVFTKELADAGHEIVDHTGDDVLIVRPAIVNLEITAPDVGVAGMSRVYVSSAGQMTLYMELFDSVTGAIVARVMDAESSDRGFGMQANSMTNKVEADRILRSWASELAEHLGEAKKETAATE